MRPLRFGYLLDFRNPAAWPRRWEEIYAESLDFIGWCETIGFEIVWLPEHHCTEDGFLTSPLMIRPSRMPNRSASALSLSSAQSNAHQNT